jgi:transposase-like protein
MMIKPEWIYRAAILIGPVGLAVATAAGWPNTPSQLAKELGISPKTLRAWLRAVYPRSAAQKGTSWLLSLHQVQAARSHFG